LAAALQFARECWRDIRRRRIAVNRIRVLLADDNPLLLRTIERLIGGEFDVIGAVGDGLSLMREARRLTPEVLVIDISMPGLSGLEVIHEARVDGLDAKIVILTCYDDPELVAEALAGGVLGYVLKPAADRDLIPAIRAVLSGRPYLSASLQR